MKLKTNKMDDFSKLNAQLQGMIERANMQLERAKLQSFEILLLEQRLNGFLAQSDKPTIRYDGGIIPFEEWRKPL